MVRSSLLGRPPRLPGGRKLILACEQRTLSVLILQPSVLAISCALMPRCSTISGMVASTAFVRILRRIVTILLVIRLYAWSHEWFFRFKFDKGFARSTFVAG